MDNPTLPGVVAELDVANLNLRLAVLEARTSRMVEAFSEQASGALVLELRLARLASDLVELATIAGELCRELHEQRVDG